MTGAVTWVALVALGVGVMILMKFTPNTLEPLWERVGAALFMGAGLVGASGMVGDFVRSTVQWIRSAVDNVAANAVGTGVMWIVALFLAAVWIGAFLPRKWFDINYPDWLMLSGLVLPLLLVSVPGMAGEGLRNGTQLVGNAAINLAEKLIGA